jgi:hypothetical protein
MGDARASRRPPLPCRGTPSMRSRTPPPPTPARRSPPATRRAYASHLRAWEAWCQAKGVPPVPAAASLVANHLAEPWY